MTGGEDRSPWPLLLMIVVVFVTPTACVLWFLREATQAQHRAIQHELTEIYQVDLQRQATEIGQKWSSLRQELVRQTHHLANAPAVSPAQLFAELMKTEALDSAVVLSAEGVVRYPDAPQPPTETPQHDPIKWRATQNLEFIENQLAQAAVAYGELAAAETDLHWRGRAWQGEARCLAKLNRFDELTALIDKLRHDPVGSSACDAQGRLIGLDLELLLLSRPPLADGASAPSSGTDAPAVRAQAAQRLATRLLDYTDRQTTHLAAPQRRFLLKQLGQLAPDVVPGRLLRAEEMAAAYVEGEPPSRRSEQLHSTRNSEVYQTYFPELQVVGLFHRERISQWSSAVASSGVLPAGASVRLIPPQGEIAAETADFSVPLGEAFPAWRLGVEFASEPPYETAAREHTSTLVWSAVLALIAIGSLGTLVALTIRQQQRTTRLKNELVATVSHELKTPLASMRVLIDTLLEKPTFDPQETREYLQMVAGENERLTRLIENFLSFSRLNQGQYAFHRATWSVAEVIRRVRLLTAERFPNSDYNWTAEVQDGTAEVFADIESLVTAILNLIENAYKHAGQTQGITCTSWSDAAHVYFAVTDCGVGLPASEQHKIFDKFYQVDQTLSRSSRGCGLGLAIVKSIVESHGGAVSVKSELGAGCRFTIQLPRSTQTR